MVAAVRVHKAGGPDVLTYEQADIPAPGSNQIRIKQAAAGINYIDTYFRTGAYPPPNGYPLILGNEGSGDVIAVGPGVTDFKVGDRVTAVFAHGGYASERNIPVDRAIKVPANISHEQAAGMMLKGMTAEYLAEPHLQGAEGRHDPGARGGGRRRSDPVPVGQASRRNGDRHGRLAREGRARQAERRAPHDPLRQGGLSPRR